MQKTVLMLLAGISTAATGVGACRLFHHRPRETAPSANAKPAVSPASSLNPNVGQLTQQELDIGSTRDLKPVPIPQGNAH